MNLIRTISGLQAHTRLTHGHKSISSLVLGTKGIKIDPETIEINCLSFDELDIHLLYNIMKIRQEIFIVEQDCPYLDADGVDINSHHITLHSSKKLIAYTRIVPPGISYDEYSSIGRVVTDPKYRINGIGTKLMNYSIEKTKALYPIHKIKISSQVYIKQFYANLGFKVVGEEYLEDDIPHIGMVFG